MEITDEELEEYWERFDIFVLTWNLVSGFFISTLVAIPLVIVLVLSGNTWGWYLMPYALVVPINIILKYVFNVGGLWLFNDTKDGDTGDPEELKKANRLGKSKLSNIIWWWFRNHSWNYNRKFIPEWEDGEYQDFRVISSSLIHEGMLDSYIDKIRWTWCSKDGKHGHHYIAARINGKIECRYSEAGENLQRQMGSGGNEYRFRFKNLIKIFKNQVLKML